MHTNPGGHTLGGLVSVFFIVGHLHHVAATGITFSPFVKTGDNPSSRDYKLEDIKVMLQLIKDKGYNEIATYGVGAPANNGPYVENVTWQTECASVVFSSLAAAQINKHYGSQAKPLQVYQGLFANFENPNQLKTEVNVGFEVARMANSIFEGTVTGIVFPSTTYTQQILDQRYKIQEVSNMTRMAGMKFGVRVTDCALTLGEKHNDPQLLEVLKHVDFLICESFPSENDIQVEGPENFAKTTVEGFKKINLTIQTVAKANNLSVEFILETGWPGLDKSKVDPTSVRDMLNYWMRMEKLAKKEHFRIFMTEAFDNPWKNSIKQLHLGAYYGLWKHKNVTDNSKAAYQLKVPSEPTSTIKGDSSSLSKELIIGLVVGLVLFTILATMILVVFIRMKRLTTRSKLTEEEIRQFKTGVVTNEVVDEKDNRNAWTRMPYNTDFEIPKDKFTIDKSALLGSGAFGSVFRGRVDGLLNEVAFKTTRPDCPVTALKGILSEIKILIYLGKHENIVSICGAYTAELLNGNVYVATELCTNGSLDKFLRNNKLNQSGYQTVSELRYVSPSSLQPAEIPEFQLYRWAFEIASAMEYISSKNVIHADLATRNVLLTLDLTAKVTDFGLSRRLYEYTEYVKKNQEPLPWRWMAPESLREMEFSVKSDAWSYGITVWEIFSSGGIPYAGLSWDVDYVNRLENGLREGRPSSMPETLFEVVSSCWNLIPQQRPSFSEIKTAVLNISTQSEHTEKEA